MSPGEWDHACDSYGKVQHSRKDCVFSSWIDSKTGFQHFKTLAGRIENHSDARVMAVAKDMYKVLKYMNHVDSGYCICPLHDGMKRDERLQHDVRGRTKGNSEGGEQLGR